MAKNTGKVREFCQSRKMGTLRAQLIKSVMCMDVCRPKSGDPPPARISWIRTKMLHHFCMTPNLPMTKKTPLPG